MNENIDLFEQIVIEAIADSNVEHIQQDMVTMSDNLDTQDNPKVGGGLITCSELHKNVWKKGYNKQMYKLGGKGPFVGDYKDTPRGIIFYNPNTNQFIINVGSWINEHKECIEEVLEEFDLYNQNVKVEIAPHWEIGCGWENM